MSAWRNGPRYQPADVERVPWTAAVAAAICAVTALTSAVVLAVRIWNGLRNDEAVTFFAVPTVLFDGSPGFALAAYVVVVLPWTVATVLASRRLFFPHRDAHRSLALLLVPAIALNVVAYAAIVSAGEPISDAHLPFGLWLVIGTVSLLLLATRRSREFESSYTAQPASWYDIDSDDGT